MQTTAVSRRERIVSESKGWRTGHVTMYAATGVLGLAGCIVYYLLLVRCDYRCYQYNAVLMIHERSRDEYEPQVTDHNVWYHVGYCRDTFEFSLSLTVFSAVAMAMSLVFGRGGTDTSEHDHTVYFSIVGQWRMVFWACLFDCWYMMKSLIVALQFTDGHRKFLNTVLRLPVDDKFRNEFENSVKPYFVTSIILFWCLFVFCVLNFVMMIYRCIMGIDFKAEFISDDDLEDVKDIESAGPSNHARELSI